MQNVYIVTRHVSYAYLGNEIKDVAYMIDRVFDDEDKAIDYIRKEIVRWHDSLVNKKCSVDRIIDETRWSRPGKRAYFEGFDGDASVFRNLYYTIYDVQ